MSVALNEPHEKDESEFAVSFQLLEDSPGSLENARFFCRASDLAYLPENEGKQKMREELGLTDAKLYSRDNTQGFLATNDDHIVLAFRGTESPTTIEGLKDWLLTDAMNLLIVPEGRLGHDLSAAGVGARFHKGFADAIAEIWDPISEAVQVEMKKKDRPLWITGHSLGGALAVFAAWLLKRKFVQVHQVVTFGAPMIGNDLACKAFDREFQGRIFRYFNGKDPVPKLPAFSFVSNEYSHVEKAVLLGDEPASTISAFLGGIAKKASDGLLSGNLVNEAWDYINQHVASHFLDVYTKLLK